MINVSNKVIQALKSDTRYITYKVLIYFDGEDNEPVDVTEDCTNIDTVDEVSESNADVPFGSLSCNSLDIELINFDRKYTVSNPNSIYYKKLIADVKVELSFIIELLDGTTEEIVGGTYYTSDWQCSTENSFATVPCYDKLFKIASLPVKQFGVKKNISVSDAYKAIFEAAGIDEKEYKIIGDLYNTIPFLWVDGDLGTNLKNISLTTGTNVYVDKYNTIVIKSIIDSSNTVYSLTDNELFVTKDANSYNSLYDSIEIKYNNSLGAEDKELYNAKVQIDSGTSTLVGLELSECPVYLISSIIIKGGSNISIVKYVLNYDTIDITIQNNGYPIEADIIVQGKIITTTPKTIRQTSSEIVRNNCLSLELPLISTNTYVTNYANLLLELYSHYGSSLDLDLRAYPILEVNDIINIDSTFAKVNKTVCIQKISASYGKESISYSITASLLKEKKIKTAYFVSPSMLLIK